MSSTGIIGFRRLAVLVFLPIFLPMLLTACSGGDQVPSLELQIIDAGRATIAAARAPKPERPSLTRAQLDKIDGSFLEVTLERRDQLAYLYVNGQRRDGWPGQITTWRTADNVTLSMRNGVLISTRGLGGDILSATVQVAGDAPGPSDAGEKIYDILALDNKVRHLVLSCDLADLGPQTIVIVERRHATRHLRETCTGGAARDGSGRAGTVVNDYWVGPNRGPGAGLVMQSRQWAGPDTGYLRMRRLIY